MDAPGEVDDAMLGWSGDAHWPRAWRAFDERLDALRPVFARWSAALGAQEDLCTKFAAFCLERL